ncbi:MAG: hypothetical protein Q8R60_11000 [Mycobacteriales bacterium]|nr:hypothetical protein [Mycobacteriales bacterium]
MRRWDREGGQWSADLEVAMVLSVLPWVLSLWLVLSVVALLLTAAICRSGHLEDEHWEALDRAGQPSR